MKRIIQGKNTKPRYTAAEREKIREDVKKELPELMERYYKKLDELDKKKCQ